MSPSEREWLLEGLNATASSFPDVVLHTLIEAQVRRTPHARAVTFGAVELDYAELNARANRLARLLRAQAGVGPDMLVAVCMERSAEMVVALLAVLKAGGAYVPLDPRLPPERLAGMIEDAAPCALLTHQAVEAAMRERLSAQARHSGTTVLDMDADAARWADQPAHDPDPAETGQTPSHAAYVIYTSGSTGRPKGVVNEHRGIVNRLAWMQKTYRLADDDSVLQKTPFGFDVSVWEFFWPLMAGARLVIARPEGHKDPAYLAALIDAEQITTLHFVPSMLSVFLEHAPRGSCRSLRRVFCSGEALPARSVHRFLERFAPTELHNLYGPTEAAIDVTAWNCGDGPLGNVVPIGRPIDNIRLYILDEQGRPTPTGVPGELHIAGTGVARGYLNRPDLTAERFVTDPFDLRPNARMYRTGDIARYLPDGQVDYLGRNDGQVKLRGFRIELGEIEAALAACPGVGDVVVRLHAETEDNARLVAFVTLDSAETCGRSEAALTRDVQAFAAEALPEYMCPSALVFLERFPLTTNGKIDTRALAAIGRQDHRPQAFTPPQSRTEQIVAEIWAALLSVERVGRDSHFLTMGGNSLLMMRMRPALAERGYGIDVEALYNHPVLKDLAARLRPTSPASQSDECMGVTVALSTGQRAALIAQVTGGEANIKSIGPVSAVQHGMIYHGQPNAGPDPYVIWQAIRFDRRERLDAYLVALTDAVARHDALRVSFHHVGLERPVQAVWYQATLPIEEVRVEPAGDILVALRRHTEAPLQRFRMDRAPLQRCVFGHDAVRDEWVLLHIHHHLCMDHATAERLHREIEASMLGETLPPAPTIPHDRALALLLSAPAQEDQRAFFATMLAGYDGGGSASGGQEGNGGTAPLEASLMLPPSLSARLRRQARVNEVGVASIFHLAWANTLANLWQHQDVVFATVMLGRFSAVEEAGDVMGQFINSLPFRVRLGAGSVREHLRSVHDSLMRLIPYEQASLALARSGTASRTAGSLTGAMLNFRYSALRLLPKGDPLDAPYPSRVTGVRYSAIVERTTWPLTLNVDDFGEDFALVAQTALEYAPEALCGHVHTSLEEIVQALETIPNRPMSRIGIIGPSEREWLLEGLNATASSFPDVVLHTLIEAQVRRTPHARAVTFGAVELDYAELNARANRLARLLRAQAGVGPDMLVAVCMERSAEMVVALLAVLKAGGAYVPLDPRLPPERLAGMIEDAAPCALLTHQAVEAAMRERLSAQARHSGTTVLDMDADAARWADQPAHDPDPAETGQTPSHAAYVIYTSGSTGRPKGVVNEHRGIVNRLAWMQKTYRLADDDSVLQKTPFGFDVSVWEFFWPLMAGARLVIARPEGHKDPAYLAALIDAEQITTLHFVPSMLSVFLEHAPRGSCRSLRRVFCSGEALPARSVHRFLERFAPTELHNLYGPTEAAIDVTAWNCGDGPLGNVVPIGRPIDNIRLYILDEQGRPTPTGVPGELHIAGTGVARGYLNRPDLTAERFVTDPFDLRPNARMYRTGDIARYLPDGQVDYLGRNDGQVKLRGFRIELGEIEAALAACPGVGAAAVVVRADPANEPRLVAYVVRTDAEADLSAAALRATLARHLPDHMLPAACLEIDALPLSLNGKLDRNALPDPAQPLSAPPLSQPHEPPCGPVEEQLAELWCNTLGIPSIGRNDHFFELGGHSLTVLGLMTRIEQVLGVSVPLSTLMANLNFAAQASAVDAAHSQAQTSATDSAKAPPVHMPTAIRPLPAQQELYTAVRFDPTNLASISTVALAFDPDGPPDSAQLQERLQSVLGRHESLRARFVVRDGALMLEPAKRFVFRVEKRESLGSLERDLRDFARPFPLDDGLNVRGRWITMGERPLLLLSFSHACVDGVAINLILGELAGADPVPDHSMSHYSIHFHDQLATMRERHAAFWRAQLSRQCLHPAGAGTRPATGELTGRWRLELAQVDKARVGARIAAARISAQEFFAVAFLRWKALLDGSSDQIVSLMFHGRDDLYQQRVVAPLMVQLPLVMTVTGEADTDLAEGAERIRQAQRHYLFDRERLAVGTPVLDPAALMPPAFFGYYPKSDFVGRIAGSDCGSLALPDLDEGSSSWRLTCEVLDRPDGFRIDLEALGYTTVIMEAAGEPLFRSVVDALLADDGLFESEHREPDSLQRPAASIDAWGEE